MTTSIEVMKDLEHIRHRHTMYTDSVDHSTKEAIDNVIDEYQAWACTYLGIALNTETNQIIIADNGRGIPVELHETEKISKLAVVFTKLHSSGKYKNREINNYNTTIGLNGVGIKVTSATSEIFEAWTKKKSKIFKVVVERGVLQQTKDGSGIVQDKLPTLPFQEKGLATVLRYNPDPTVFGVKYCRISPDYLKELCSNLQYLCPTLSIELIIDGSRSVYMSSRGISGLLEPKESDLECKRFQLNSDSLTLVLWWNPQEDGESILSYVNCQKTKDGGTHVTAIRSAITEAFGEAGKTVSTYLREGLRCAFHLKIADPQFQGQNKHRLLNPEASDLINKQVTRNLELFLAENPKIRDAVLQRASALKKAHETFKKDKEAIKNLAKGRSKSLSLPDKLISASHCSPEQRELFICLKGDTKVQLVDGSTPTIKEMADNPDREYWGFTYDKNKDWIDVALLVNPRQTQDNASVIQITLDNGSCFSCTPDHLILRRDNMMVRADALNVGDSLRKGTIIEKDGYLRVYQSKIWGNRSYLVHRMLYQKCIPDVVSRFDDIHHIDENKLNNTPTNLMRLSHGEHSRMHGVFTKYHSEPMNKGKRAEFARQAMANSQNRLRLSKQAKEQWDDLALRQWRSEKTKQQFEDITEKNKQSFLECCRLVVRDYQQLTKDLYDAVATAYQLSVPDYYNHVSVFYQKKSNVFLALEKTYGIDSDLYIRANYHKMMRILIAAHDKGKILGSRIDYSEEKKALGIEVDIHWQLKQAYPNLNIKSGSQELVDAVERYKMEHNHKIIGIEKEVESTDVYCLTVPKTKNFLLANGIFVHNCEGASAAGPIIKARNRPLYQEVYMLKGKITNACRAEMGKVLANADIIGIIQSIGCGILDDCDPKKSRVGKVLLISDADFDGRHIDALLTAFFITYMAPMVEAGRIYRVKSPLYVATYRDQHWYGTGLSDQAALTDAQDKIPDNLKNKIGRSDGVTITRFKGHGAASADAIRDYALGSKRELEVIRLPVGDIDIINNLMGDDVTARKELLAIDW